MVNGPFEGGGLVREGLQALGDPMRSHGYIVVGVGSSFGGGMRVQLKGDRVTKHKGGSPSAHLRRGGSAPGGPLRCPQQAVRSLLKKIPRHPPHRMEVGLSVA